MKLIIHVVKPNDSIYSISRRYGVEPEKIIADNELTSPENLVIGQSIVVTNGTRRHTVLSGQSLFSIARDYNIELNRLIAANPQLPNPNRLQPGQVVIIPQRTEKLGTIDVNGFAFANIDREVLNKTLPHLTYLSIFSHQVLPDGSLQDIDDRPLIAAARQAGVAPIMVITNLREGEGFSSELANTILTNQQVQDNLIENVVATLQEKSYFGLDVDFEYIFQSDRENYNNFLERLVQRLKPLGYTISSSIAPKTSADQRGLLYEAHDYPVHGNLLDHVIIMTYEWGYTYGPAMAVSPENQVRRVLNYAVTAIPRQKIFMGLPNYGYDWTLPFVRGSAAINLTNRQAVELAQRVGANIQYNYESAAPFFRYYDESGAQHEVWFNDARSYYSLLSLINQYNLGGASYWTIMSYDPQNWLVLESMYNVRKVL